MAGCSHGWMYRASGGYGRCKYTFCCLCRSLQTAEAMSPGKAAEANSFLKDKADALKPEKSVSVRATKVAELYVPNKDNMLAPSGPITGAVEDEFLSGFGSMADRWDTDRLRDAILGILEGSVRSAESKYGIDRNTIFRVRLIIATDGVEAGVEKLLDYVRKHRPGAVVQDEKKAA